MKKIKKTKRASCDRRGRNKKIRGERKKETIPVVAHHEKAAPFHLDLSSVQQRPILLIGSIGILGIFLHGLG